MKKILVSLLVIYSMLLFGCPKPSQIRTAAQYGYDTSERTRTAQTIVIELYRKQLVSLAQKNQFFDAAKGAFDFLEIYTNVVEHQKQLVEAGTQTTDAALAVLRDLLNSQGIDKLNALIVALNLMNPLQAGKLFAWVKTIASATLKVFDIFNIAHSSLVAIKA